MPQPVIASPNVPSKYQISIAPPRPLTDDPFPLKQDNILKAGGYIYLFHPLLYHDSEPLYRIPEASSLIHELAGGIVDLAQKLQVLRHPSLIYIIRLFNSNEEFCPGHHQQRAGGRHCKLEHPLVQLDQANFAYRRCC